MGLIYFLNLSGLYRSCLDAPQAPVYKARKNHRKGNYMRMVFILSLLFSVSALANSTSALRSSDPLARTTARIATQLADGNITTGTTRVHALQLKDGVDADDFKALTAVLFKEAFELQTDQKLPAVRLSLTAKNFTDEMVSDLAVAMGESNAFDSANPENTKSMQRQAWVVLRRLPVDEDTKVGMVKVRLRQDPQDADSARNVYYFVFFDTDSRKLVQFFLIEGTM